MAAVNRAALNALKELYLVSGGRQTNAANVRALVGALIESLATIVDDKDVDGGYPGITSGRINTAWINQAVPAGKYLKDDGTWESILTTALAGLSISANYVTASTTLVDAISAIEGKLQQPREEAGVTHNLISFRPCIANNGAQVACLLPAVARIGTIFTVVGKGAGGWKVSQNAGQVIQMGATTTTIGAGGNIASANRYDSVTLMCVTADTEFTVVSHSGVLVLT